MKKSYFPNHEKGKKITVILRFIIIATMIASFTLGIISVLTDSYSSDNKLFISSFTLLILLIITFIPAFVRNKRLIIIPAFLETGIIIFTFLAMYLGEVFRFYELFWWWDIMLHSLSAFMLGLLGFLLFYTLNKSNFKTFRLNNTSIMIFAFCFAISCGVAWEIFEFAGDWLFGMNMQKSVYIQEFANVSQNANIIPYKQYLTENVNKYGRIMDPGLVDTMKDLIVDCIGAFAAVVVARFFVHESEKNGVGDL